MVVADSGKFLWVLCMRLSFTLVQKNKHRLAWDSIYLSVSLIPPSIGSIDCPAPDRVQQNHPKLFTNQINVVCQARQASPHLQRVFVRERWNNGIERKFWFGDAGLYEISSNLMKLPSSKCFRLLLDSVHCWSLHWSYRRLYSSVPTVSLASQLWYEPGVFDFTPLINSNLYTCILSTFSFNSQSFHTLNRLPYFFVFPSLSMFICLSIK